MRPVVICDLCGDTFVATNTMEEAKDEHDALFEEELGDDLAIVCDDCWPAFLAGMLREHPEAFK